MGLDVYSEKLSSWECSWDSKYREWLWIMLLLRTGSGPWKSRRNDAVNLERRGEDAPSGEQELFPTAHPPGRGLPSEADGDSHGCMILWSRCSPRERELTNCHFLETRFTEGFPVWVPRVSNEPREACSCLRNLFELLAERWRNGYSPDLNHLTFHSFIHQMDLGVYLCIDA